MYYGEDVIEEVRARNDILDVISGAVHLEKRGGNYVGLCPFHNEKTPSFTVTPAKQMFYCFGCGVGGNVYSFVQKYDNITFREAVEQLADRAGYALPKAAPSAAEQKKREQKDILLAINKEAAIWFFHRLREDAGKAGMQYFIRRGLTPETMQRFGLGFAPVSRGSLCAYLRGRGYRDADIVAAGVALRDEQHGLRDRFWNRVMFPIQDVNKRVIGFGGRVLGDGEVKYLNSPETPVFDKSRNLYGLCYARAARKGHILLCEGYLDVIAMHQAGFTQAVASLGTSFTIGQANILKRYTDDVYLAYDSDPAGKAAVLRASAILREAGLRAKIVRLAPYKDPDELIRAEGASAMEQRIAEAENPFVYEVEILRDGFRMDDPDDVTAFHKAVAERLAGVFRDASERENYLQAVCARYHIDPQIMKDLVARIALRSAGPNTEDAVTERSVNRDAPRREKTDHSTRSQRRLLTLLSEDERVYPAIRTLVTAEDFTDPFCREIAQKTFDALKAGKFDPARMLDEYEDDPERDAYVRVFHEAPANSDVTESRETELHEVIESILRLSVDARIKASDPSDASYLPLVREGKQRLEAFHHKQIHL